MLKGISPLLSPRLLATLCRMGHGDEIVLADAHFPASLPGGHPGPLTLRADGVPIAALLNGMLPLFEIDSYAADPLVLMAPVEGDVADPAVAADYRTVIDRHAPETPPFARMERTAFYERAKSAFAIVITGEMRAYGNLILKKGVTPLS